MTYLIIEGGMTYPIIFVVIVTYAIAWLAAKWLVSTIRGAAITDAPRGRGITTSPTDTVTPQKM
jgi:hypothetical protein